jgi:hypothetical protein
LRPLAVDRRRGFDKLERTLDVPPMLQLAGEFQYDTDVAASARGFDEFPSGLAQMGNALDATPEAALTLAQPGTRSGIIRRLHETVRETVRGLDVVPALDGGAGKLKDIAHGGIRLCGRVRRRQKSSAGCAA